MLRRNLRIHWSQICSHVAFMHASYVLLLLSFARIQSSRNSWPRGSVKVYKYIPSDARFLGGECNRNFARKSEYWWRGNEGTWHVSEEKQQFRRGKKWVPRGSAKWFLMSCVMVVWHVTWIWYLRSNLSMMLLPLLLLDHLCTSWHQSKIPVIVLSRCTTAPGCSQMENSSESLWPGGIRSWEAPEQFSGTAQALEIQSATAGAEGWNVEKAHSILHMSREILICWR